MKHLKSYQLFESNRTVVTFDFDGTLHTGVYQGTIHPLADPDKWTPSDRIIAKMREEAETHDVYIVTARNGDRNFGNPWVTKFAEDNDLPIKGIICTNDWPKRPYLKSLKSIRHYDDNVELVQDLKGSGIELVLVDPTGVSEDKIYLNGIEESERESTRYWYHGTDKDFDTFEMRGEKGPSVFGIWFSEDPDGAKVFGEKIMKAELNFGKPHVITMDEWDDIRLEHAKDTEYFKKWKDKLMKDGHDALYVKGRDVKFAGRDLRDAAMVAVFDVSQIVSATKINEGVIPGAKGGLIIIKGPELEDKTHRLYIAQVSDIFDYARTKKSGEPGQAAAMAHLSGMYWRITQDDNGLLRAVRIGDTPERLMSAMGLKDANVVLNSQKTPAHWMTIKQKNPDALVRDMEEVIRNISNVRWYK